MICVVSAPVWNKWFLLSDLDQRQLGTDLAEMSEICQLVASPESKWLAVVSVPEGHPILEIVDLPRLIDNGHYRVVQRIDPYPGTLSIDRWDRGCLLIESYMLLTRLGKNRRPLDEDGLEEPELFSMDPQTGKITRLNPPNRDRH